MGVDTNKLASMVIGYSGGASVKPVFRLDTTKYSWVKDYVRDQKLRSEIKHLQDEIIATNALPIRKSELKQMFEARIKQINEFRIRQLVAHLDEVQRREKPLINELMINALKLNGAWFDPVLINLSGSDMDEIFSHLQDGVLQKDIEKTAKQLQEKIVNLEKIIADELSPRDRWFHKDSGLPESYPQGCRWTPFVEVWRRVAAKFEGKVDIEGHTLKTSEEFEAFGLLELDRVRKQPPLRKPFK
jgi:hypothetical protein